MSGIKKKYKIKTKKFRRPPKGKSINGYTAEEAAHLQHAHAPNKNTIAKSTAKRRGAQIRNRDMAKLDPLTGHSFGGVDVKKKRKKKKTAK